MSLKKNTDVLGSHKTGPWLSLTSAELAHRGLLLLQGGPRRGARKALTNRGVALRSISFPVGSDAGSGALQRTYA